MSTQRGNGQNGGHFYSNVTWPVALSCNFVVDSTNGNGLGIRNIKSNGYVENVFMHTTASPGVGGNGITNPNPEAGIIMVQFKNNFKTYLGGFSGFVSPTTGSTLTSITSHTPYIIASLGTTTLAQWVAAGVPVGVTPAVGLSFVAIETASIGGTGTVLAVGTSGCVSVEVIGNTDLATSASIATNSGEWLILQCLNGSSAVTAPANNTVVGMTSFFDRSTVTIDGL
jgi:hypothetical protein